MDQLAEGRLKHFRAEHVCKVVGIIEIVETDPSGLGKATFTIEGEGVQVKGLRQKPLLHALSSWKCADGAFLTFDDTDVHLHIVELKSTVTVAKWRHAVEQFCGMYFVASSIAHLLGHSNLASIKCYIALDEDKIMSENTASPVLLKTLTGGNRTLGEVENWKSSLVPLPFDIVPLTKAIRIGGDVDFGLIS